VRWLALAILVLPACSSRSDIRLVERPAPSETKAPTQQRFEVVETASLETGSKVELWVPLASEEPGVQKIERLDVTIKPVTPYEVTADSRGNRILHLACEHPISVSVAYRVSVTELDATTALAGKKKETRPLDTRERATLAPELGPTLDGELATLREAGTPARRVFALRIDTRGLKVRRDLEPPLETPEIPQTSWIEVYVPGLAWVPEYLVSSRPPAELRSKGILLVAHGAETALPFATIDGSESAPRLGWKTTPLDSP
jgi:hypothetical protein